MAKIVELRDPYTAGHQLRAAALADAIAKEMQFDTRRIDRLRMAAIIHDIGKVSIPADILNKSSVLTDAEVRLVQTHSQRGYEIVRNMNLVPEIAQAVWQHHERWDGSGYPRGLKGNELQMEARIIAVADVVEAMSAHRSYRPALGIDAALGEIVNNAGKLYAPEVARACVAVFREGRFEFPTDKPSTGLV
jgi:putative nucleotidyltransferase with HDIG domain